MPSLHSPPRGIYIYILSTGHTAVSIHQHQVCADCSSPLLTHNPVTALWQPCGSSATTILYFQVQHHHNSLYPINYDSVTSASSSSAHVPHTTVAAIVRYPTPENCEQMTGGGRRGVLVVGSHYCSPDSSLPGTIINKRVKT